MSDFDDIGASLRAQVERLRSEATTVYLELVLPSWGSATQHGFPATVWGYVMSGFAAIDLASYYDSPSVRQTDRMRGFLNARLGAPPDVAAVAVQLWRHTLMHTGTPRPVSGETSDTSFTFLLHWGAEQLPREQHLRLLPGTRRGEQVLGLGALYLLQDLHEAAARLVQGWADSSASRERVTTAHARLLRQQVVRDIGPRPRC